jgi:hypothetical protein
MALKLKYFEFPLKLIAFQKELEKVMLVSVQ